MQNQTAAYLPSPGLVIMIVYQKEPYQYFAVFVNQTRQQVKHKHITQIVGVEVRHGQ